MNPENFYALLPEIVVLSGIAVIVLSDLFIKQKNARITFYLTQALIIIAALISFLQLPTDNTVILYGSFIRDHLATLLKLFIMLSTLMTFALSRNYLSDRNIDQGAWYTLGLFSMLGMMVLVSSFNLVTLYLSLELLSLPLYAMIAMQRKSDVAVEAAMKFFILAALASALLLYGMSLIYGMTHSLDISTIATQITHLQGPQLAIVSFATLFIIAGIAFKFGAVPFHSWVADVYQGSPLAVTLLIGSAPKIAAFGMAIRLLVDMLTPLLPEWQIILIVLAIASMAIGNLLAIAQTSLRRMLGYSSIAQMGYMLLGLIAGNNDGYAAASFYTITYALTALAGFTLLTIMSRKGVEVDAIDDLSGLNARHPWLAFMMMLVLFSMAGIPPLVGFFAKVLVLEALIRIHLIWLAAVALLLAVIGTYYYIRVIKVIYFEEPIDSTAPKLALKGGSVAIFTANSLLLLLLGILPTLLFTVCRQLF
ncbi:MAG: NADH-quinone oxidoreductase subunit NuoN [Gammaproteobacteria bacterium]|nr:NADH-quinone oxidoreductase subunit NuoN [Gammaproteobacteria bacterium]